MDNYQPTIREKLSDLMFNTTFGTVACAVICIVLCVLLFVVGYIAAGIGLLALALRHEEKTGEKPAGTHGGLGTVLLWPIAIIMMILDKDTTSVL